jgi:hypothetical protein
MGSKDKQAEEKHSEIYPTHFEEIAYVAARFFLH